MDDVLSDGELKPNPEKVKAIREKNCNGFKMVQLAPLMSVSYI